MRVAFGTDESTDLTSGIVDHLTSLGHEVVGPVDAAWPLVGQYVGRAVATGEADRGIVCCWTGTGVSIAANKIGGVRAALCSDAETARGARRWNDANVLALGLRVTSSAMAREIVDAFLADEQVDPEEVHNIGLVENPE
ncbi:MAG: RpiB/LacA/LacB family sugar-phosphate isomerase [Acidimicrobiales bacterium]|nr:RpiB/LacA/LacB family sugar-phosphate isomerase [Acidimicrobiales bacterium]